MRLNRMSPNTCRVCIQKCEQHFDINGSFCASASLKIKEALQSCIPELDVDLFPQSVICKNCMLLLQILYQFKIESLKNECMFRNKQFIRLQNLDVLVKGDDQNLQHHRLENIEVELNNIEELKTEFIYVNSENEVMESISKNLQNCTIIDNNVNEELCKETSEVLECSLLVPTGDTKSTNSQPKKEINVKKNHDLDIKKFIQCTTTSKKKRDIRRPHKCTECDFCSHTKASLVMHYRIHTGEKPFHCTKCPYQAKRKSHLEDHLKIHTGERPFVCPICSKSFITKQILKKHKLIHTEEKPYRCSQCNFRSRHKLSIANHVKKTHIGIEKVTTSEPCMCYICGKKLSGRSSLNTHMKIHTGIKKHLCELCGKYFREKGMLKNHLRTHTKEKPFKCTQCDYIATRKAHLQEHMQTHVPHRELIQCTICSKQYTTKLLLKKHMNEKHKDLDNKEVQAEFGYSQDLIKWDLLP